MHPLTSSNPVDVREVRSRRDLRGFVELPYRLYREDPLWVPPLRSDVRRRLSPRHPFFERARMALFCARSGPRLSGRIAAIVNEAHNEVHAERCGFFGFFETEEEPAVARALLDAAERWCAAQGATILRGPVSPSTNDECGLLVEGFHLPPVFMMPYNPPWYAERFESFGLHRAMDLLAYELVYGDHMPFARLRRIRDRLASREGLRIRPVRLEKFDEEMQAIRAIYNRAWEKNWGFVPLSEREFRHVARQMRPILKPELTLIAEVRGAPAGFSLTLPDVNRALKHAGGRLFPLGLLKLLFHLRRIDSARVITLGILPEHRHLGLEALLYLETIETGPRVGFPRGELSWILETNEPMIRGIETLGGKLIKRYRIYEKEIGGGRPG